MIKLISWILFPAILNWLKDLKQVMLKLSTFYTKSIQGSFTHLDWNTSGRLTKLKNWFSRFFWSYGRIINIWIKICHSSHIFSLLHTMISASSFAREIICKNSSVIRFTKIPGHHRKQKKVLNFNLFWTGWDKSLTSFRKGKDQFSVKVSSKVNQQKRLQKSLSYHPALWTTTFQKPLGLSVIGYGTKILLYFYSLRSICFRVITTLWLIRHIHLNFTREFPHSLKTHNLTKKYFIFHMRINLIVGILYNIG